MRRQSVVRVIPSDRHLVQGVKCLGGMSGKFRDISFLYQTYTGASKVRISENDHLIGRQTHK